jgi:hypothetical protein
MAGVVRKDRLLAALLVVAAGVLVADVAGAVQLPDSSVRTTNSLVWVPFYIKCFCYSMAVIFASWAAYRWIYNARKKIPLKPVRFGLVVFTALLFASIPSILGLISDYYSRNP